MINKLVDKLKAERTGCSRIRPDDEVYTGTFKESRICGIR